MILPVNWQKQAHVERLSLTPVKTSPHNNLIPDRTKKMRLKDYIGKDFLVKISAGHNYFGFDFEEILDKYRFHKKSEKSIEEMQNARQQMIKEEYLVVYDEFRFISGTVKNDKLFDMVMQLGKLSGEQLYAKRLYVNARISGRNKNELNVRTDELFHDQGW